MLDISPYEPCPCGSQKKHKFCCKPNLDKALELVRLNRDSESEQFFGVDILRKWVENDTIPERRKEWESILNDRLKYGLPKNISE